MADKISIARMKENAVTRLLVATAAISRAANVAPATLPEPNRDPEYHQAATLTALADWAEQAAAALSSDAAPIKAKVKAKVKAKGK